MRNLRYKTDKHKGRKQSNIKTRRGTKHKETLKYRELRVAGGVVGGGMGLNG